MEEQLNPLAVTHLLQHTLRSLCSSKNSQWIYAVFWRILPRNYPPPKWDFEGGVYDRNRGNRRNWILAWEDGFCNFAASSSAYEVKGLQPQLFFKMSHEIYNYGEGLIGKVAADHSHKYVFKDPKLNELNSISTRNSPSDAEPRTWEAQFQSGIQTITLVAVKEGVVQLGSLHEVRFLFSTNSDGQPIQSHDEHHRLTKLNQSSAESAHIGNPYYTRRATTLRRGASSNAICTATLLMDRINLWKRREFGN